MGIRGEIVIECDQRHCQAEIVIPAEDANILHGKHGGIELDLFAPDWEELEDGTFCCPQCSAPEERDEVYEHAAARARNNGFAETGGRDWT